MEDSLYTRMIECCRALSIAPTPRFLLVSISRQRLYLGTPGQPVWETVASTSARPPSNLAGSHGTPTGLHAIGSLHGDGQPLGMVFVAREPIGRCFWEVPPADQARNLITTRILRLRGLEPGHNQGPGCDSWERFIYFHGTNHEDRLGTPFSLGCIELANAAILDLYARVEPGDLVYIG